MTQCVWNETSQVSKSEQLVIIAPKIICIRDYCFATYVTGYEHLLYCPGDQQFLYKNPTCRKEVSVRNRRLLCTNYWTQAAYFCGPSKCMSGARKRRQKRSPQCTIKYSMAHRILNKRACTAAQDTPTRIIGGSVAEHASLQRSDWLAVNGRDAQRAMLCRSVLRVGSRCCVVADVYL